jgi:hypothetical protein
MEALLAVSPAVDRRCVTVLGIATLGVVCGKGQGAAKGFRLPREEPADSFEPERFLELVSDSEGLAESDSEGTREPN